MSEATIEAQEAEAYEGEAGFGGEGIGEASPEGAAWGSAWGSASSDDARRRRQQQILMARQAQLRPPPTPAQPPAPAPQGIPRVTAPSTSQLRAIQTDVISLDLDTRAALNRVRRDLDAADRLAYRNAWAAEASAASALILDQFDDALENYDWARALLIGAPTLLLAPRRKRKPGLEGFITDPRVAGGLGLAVIFGVGRLTKDSRESRKVHTIRLNGPNQLNVDDSVTLTAEALDGRGNKLTDVPITFESDNEDYVTVDKTGKITGVGAGTARIKATGDGAEAYLYVTVS